MPESLNMINLGFLSDSERQMILDVLRRDEELRQTEERRVRKLKTELLEVKRKGAKRSNGNYSEQSCGRCQEPLSRLQVFSSQCKTCQHKVCRSCQTTLPDGSWLCSVCVKESEIKKRTGDWFYDQRVNRFSETPAHDLVRASLKKKPLKKRETAGEVLLKVTDTNQEPPRPVPLPRQKPQLLNKSCSSEKLGSITSRDSFESKSSLSSKPPPSDVKSAENCSIASVNEVDGGSGRLTPEEAGTRSERSERSVTFGSTGSITSSRSGAVKSDVVSTDSGDSNTNAVINVKPGGLSPEIDVEKLFKKSIKRPQKSEMSVSTADLRCPTPKTSMGNRSLSVSGLDAQEDEEEEEEDIDSLVKSHKDMIATSSSSLRSSMSTMSIYSDAGDYSTVEVSGQIVFTLRYDEHTQSLQVFIRECQDLAHGDTSRKLSNPYVKCYLLPDKSRQSKKKTGTKKNTVNPIFNKTLKYSISRSELVSRSVLISVWHQGQLSRNVFLGEVIVPLAERNLDSPQEECLHLVGKTSADDPTSLLDQNSGELVISLKYIPAGRTTGKVKGKKSAQPEKGELHVLIKEARNLKAGKSGGTLDSFVKGHLFPSKAKHAKMKTAIVKKNLNPHFDTTFVYKDVDVEQLKGMCLELSVWDKESAMSNELLGGIRLSCGRGSVKLGKEELELDSVGEEISLWEKMMQYTDSWAEGTLSLRSTMAKRKGK